MYVGMYVLGPGTDPYVHVPIRTHGRHGKNGKTTLGNKSNILIGESKWKSFHFIHQF